jgi:hypothetical protein
MVRFARPGRVQLPDERVQNEIAVMTIVRERTTIAVPSLKAWGVSDENKLGLGAFIMTTFVEGVDLGKFLHDHDYHRFRMRQVEPHILERIYRQVIRFQLQLSQIDFPRIGGLRKARDGNSVSVVERPFTFRAHETVQLRRCLGEHRSQLLPWAQLIFGRAASYDIQLSFRTFQPDRNR